MKTLLQSPKPFALNILASILMLVFATSVVSAQVSSYTLTQFPGEYISIANDDVSTTFAQNYDDGTVDLSLPFKFTYDGNLFGIGTLMTFSSNGFLVIGSDPGAVPDDVNWGVADNVSNAIMPFSGDLVLNDFNFSGGSFAGFSEVTGTAPNRVLTYEWQDFIIFSYDGFTSGGMQVKLYETTNVIEFLYRNPGYAFSGDILQPTGGFNDPCVFSVGLNGSPFSSDNNLYTNNASALPSSDLRFTPPITQNIQLSVEPKTLSFGQIQAGTPSAAQCVSVVNAGTLGTLSIASAVITGASDFAIVSSPESNNYNVGDPAGQYCIVFTPTTSGLRSATLTISSNGQDSGLQTVSLTGVGALADYTIDSLIRFKKTKTRLGDTLTQYLHITSTGLAPLFFSAFNISGFDAGQYFVSYKPVNPLAPGQSDSIGISYVPTIEGRHTATLTLLSNAFLNPSVDITLQGTGILPHIVVTPTVLLFDSTREGDTVCKNLDIWNPGSDTLKIFSNSLTSNDGDFHYAGLNLENSVIPPDNHKIVTVCFVPIQRGTRQARLLLRTNIIKTFDTPRRDTASTVTIDIRGNGVPFGVFGNAIAGAPFIDSALIGVKVCRLDSLKNNGDGDILVSGLTIGGNQFNYSGLPPFPFILKARSFLTFNICGTPNVQGLITGTATVSGTTGGTAVSETISLNVYGFKTCIAALPPSLFDNPAVILPNNGSDSTLCTTITNCGDIPAIYNVAISGVSKADYTVTPGVSPMIAPKGSTTFCVKYKPSIIGASPASLDVTGSEGSTVQVPLNGAAGCASITANTFESPNTGVGAKDTFTVTVNNRGTFPLILGAGQVLPAGAHFNFIAAIPDTIPPGGSSAVTIEFVPINLGSFGGLLTFPNAGPCISDTLNISLHGVGIVNAVRETASEGYTLDQSYPNPTQGNTSFSYTTPRETEISIKLVDLTGKLIRTLITGRVSEGSHVVNFDVKDLPSGTYIYLLESGSTKLVRQLILTK